MTKRKIMKKIYSEKELNNIDSAIPIQYWKTHKPSNHIMNYNENGVFGKIECLTDVAKERDIQIN